MNLVPVVNQSVAEYHTLGEEERHAGSFVTERKETELFAELAVVALFSLFELFEVCGELFLGLKSRAVDTLQHLVFFVAAPVCACDGQELKRLDLFGIAYVRAGAEVGKFALTVKADFGVLGEVVDELYLVRLVLHQLESLCTGQGKALDFEVFFNYFSHFSLDLLEDFGSEYYVAVEVVVKARVNGRTDSKLCLWIKALDSLCEHVRR